MSEQNQASAADKSHDPTPEKLRKSREKGEVAYSTEVTTAATYAGFFIALLIAGGWSMLQLHSTLTLFLHRPDAVASALLAPESNGFSQGLMLRVLSATAPIFAAIAGAAICSIIAQRAFVVAPSKIKPKLSKLSIISNAKQKFGPNGLSEFAKSAAKLIAVFAILAFAAKDLFLNLPALSLLPATAILPVLYKDALLFCGLVTLAAALIAGVDLPWRYFQHHNKLKMTYQEVKEESKESEGDPALKGERRRRAEEIATNRMMADVPKADVVIVNPTHYAVALQWDRKNLGAPKCVAKGVDEVAARIRESAAAAGVPIKRDPPTARSIHSLVKIGEEIKREHYAAVAAAIHYAEKLRRKKFKKKSPA